MMFLIGCGKPWVAVERNAAAIATKMAMVPAAHVATLEAVVPAAAVYVPIYDELSEESADRFSTCPPCRLLECHYH